tara:strand:+ start:1333 stop:2160 length:828 start_codon:yes stop_codon:yes gene_type:complete
MRLSRKKLRKLILQEIKRNLIREDAMDDFDDENAIADMANLLPNFSKALKYQEYKIDPGSELYNAIIESIKKTLPGAGGFSKYPLDAKLLTITPGKIPRLLRQLDQADREQEEYDQEFMGGDTSTINEFRDAVFDEYEFNPANYSYKATDNLYLVLPFISFDLPLGKEISGKGSEITLTELLSSNTMPSNKGLVHYTSNISEHFEDEPKHNGYGSYLIKISRPAELRDLFKLFGVDMTNPGREKVSDAEYDAPVPDRIQIGDGEEGPFFADPYDD